MVRSTRFRSSIEADLEHARFPVVQAAENLIHHPAAHADGQPIPVTPSPTSR